MLAWTPDGKGLVVSQGMTDEPDALYMYSVSTGEGLRLTSPPESSVGDCCPAFSPVGAVVSFL